MDLKSAKAHLTAELARARRALAIERALPLAAPAAIAAGLWAALGLFGLLDAAPPLAASLGVIAALALIAWLARRGAGAFRRPTAREARARLEADAALDLGSLAAAEDRPALLDPGALALWRREQERAGQRLAAARAKAPRPRFDAVDPFRLRYVAALALAGGIAVAGLEGPDRLARAFAPDPGPLVGDRPLLIEAWATPAAYVGAGPIPLSDREGERIETPPRLTVTVRVAGAAGAPKLVFAGDGRRRAATFARTADGAWEAKLDIDHAGELSVVRFRTKARWRLAPVADSAPTAAFVDAPALEGHTLTFAWEAEDDYGVRGVALEFTPRDPPEGLVGAPPYRVALEVPPGEPRSARGEATLDLAPHPYAGLAVDVRLVAFDALDQAGRGGPHAVALPEPPLLQPTARAALEIRRAIQWERRAYAAAPLDRLFPPRGPVDPLRSAPPGMRRAAGLLDGLMVAPQDGYFPDLAVYAGLALSRATLGQARTIPAADVAADHLWRVALRAEYGASADARRGLEAAQRALAEAIARGAPPEEIARLSDGVRDAMRRYLDALVAEALREGRVAENEDDREQEAELGRQDLDALLDEVQRLAESGQMDQALQLLSQIAGLLDGLEVRLVEGDGEGGARPSDPQLNEAIQGLSGAMGEQRALRDQTDETARGEGGRDGEGGGAGDLARRQEELAGAVGEARRRIGEGAGDGEEGRRAAEEAGRAVGEAERAMREAGRALRQGDLDAARQRQDEALSALRSGADRLAQEQLRQDGARDRGRAGGGGARDPLGRAMSGGDGEGVGVPDQIDGERAREIRDELRRRAQDPRRPEAEREYLRRLLERFEGA